MMTQPTENVPENSVPAEPATEPQTSEQSTVDVPVSAIGEAQAGDVVSMKVVSRNDEAGTATLSPTTETEPDGDEAGGTEGMADEFQSPQSMKGT